MLLQILQVLVFILSQRLRNLWVLNDVEHCQCLLLQPLVCGYGIISLAGKFCWR